MTGTVEFLIWMEDKKLIDPAYHAFFLGGNYGHCSLKITIPQHELDAKHLEELKSADLWITETVQNATPQYVIYFSFWGVTPGHLLVSETIDWIGEWEGRRIPPSGGLTHTEQAAMFSDQRSNIIARGLHRGVRRVYSGPSFFFHGAEKTGNINLINEIIARSYTLVFQPKLQELEARVKAIEMRMIESLDPRFRGDDSRRRDDVGRNDTPLSSRGLSAGSSNCGYDRILLEINDKYKKPREKLIQRMSQIEKAYQQLSMRRWDEDNVSIYQSVFIFLQLLEKRIHWLYKKTFRSESEEGQLKQLMQDLHAINNLWTVGIPPDHIYSFPLGSSSDKLNTEKLLTALLEMSIKDYQLNGWNCTSTALSALLNSIPPQYLDAYLNKRKGELKIDKKKPMPLKIFTPKKAKKIVKYVRERFDKAKEEALNSTEVNSQSPQISRLSMT